MSLYPSATVFWGFQVSADVRAEMASISHRDYGSDYHIAMRYGLKQPPFVPLEQDPEAHQKWLQSLEDRRTVVQRTGCEILSSGSTEWSENSYFAGISASVWKDAHGKHSKTLLPHAEHGWEELLRSFCDKMNIPWQEPAWRLIAWYG